MTSKMLPDIVVGGQVCDMTRWELGPVERHEMTHGLILLWRRMQIDYIDPQGVAQSLTMRAYMTDEQGRPVMMQ